MKLIIFISAILAFSCDSKDSKNDEAMAHDHAQHDAADHGAEQTNTTSDLTASASGSLYGTITFDSDSLAKDTPHTAGIKFFDKDSNMVMGAVIDDITPWMVTMGHGSNEEQIDFHQHDDMGHHWMVNGIIFTMAGEAGEWVIKVSVSFDGKEDQIDIPVPSVQ